MRDLVAIAVVVVLVIFALSMATSLQWYRQGHARLRRRLRARGQSVVAEIPTADGLTFFSEDPTSFYWGEVEIPKEQIRAVRVLISGAPISVAVSSRFETTPAATSADPHDPLTGLERDRWDVEVDLGDERVLVECGAIRERVSQELARQVFEAIRTDMESREARLDHHSGSATPRR